MRLEGLIKPLIENNKYSEIVSLINKNKSVEIEGIADSARSLFISAISQSTNKPIVLIANSDMEAKNIYEDLNLFLNNVYYFPTKEVVFYNIDAISGDLRWERLKVIKQILSNKNNVIVTSIEAFSLRLAPKDLYYSHQISIKVGMEANIKTITKLLVEGGYDRVDMVEGKGEFSLRGGILDVYPADSIYPYRIEFFGDEVDTIRTFNLTSQRSIENIKSINIFPAKEIIIDEDNINYGINRIKEESDKLLKNIKNKDRANRIKKTINSNIEQLKETGTFEVIDSYLPFFYEKTESLFDYLNDYIYIIDDKIRTLGKVDSVYLEFNENYSIFLERGDILPSQIDLLIPKEKLLDNIKNRTRIIFDSILQNDSIFSVDQKYEIKASSLNNYQGQLDLLIQDIFEKKSNNNKIIILSGTRARGERLVNTLRDRGIESVYKEEISEVLDGQVIITFGNLLRGFQCKEINLCIISDKEVFGEAKRKYSKKRSSKKGIGKIKSFAELKPGDYVVHVNHGIGVYKGIKQIEVAGHKRDYLDIVYDKGDKLYVPVEQLDMLQKYIGSEGKNPKVNKLGGNEWQKAKSKVRESINKIAEDLVKLYAERSAIKGYRFSKDTEWQKQFEDEFPYEETPDQLSSLEEIKNDMESDKIMDRLLCGDVGYGKTEVAFRASFKAIMDGKQVAFLVPTTILAEQHYKNMKSRFSDFPISIDMISRFRTPKEQKATLKAAKEGNVDIIVGTHRLVSKDIEFKNLGLLIVDEEQRFGVTQKEKIKNVQKNVDVLTLSATPIPRTLHMSLSGVRDISVIETPPEERYPIQTYVVEQNDQLIRDAIMRELSRGGQVYFVYNRVENIEKMAAYIQSLVPESKVTKAHGQMTERQLEKEMMAFMDKEYDVLVCTTIIETGIDIPNVNTIIVYDADKMGLSQLYQLRGRVGRSNRIAYAYLLYTKDKVLTEVAEKRLKALKDFTELGSGFKIAMRDLEIRGAGNIMGSAQHGHMATVGYDLYCKMLEDTVKLIKGEIDKEPIETTIDLKVDAYIPSSYIQDEIQKIEIYKKIAAIESNQEYMDIKEELEDRYSEIPEPIYNLMDIAYIKNCAKNLFIEEIKEDSKYIIFKFAKNESKYKEIFKKIIKENKENVLLIFGENPQFMIKIQSKKKEEMLKYLKKILQQ
ncbi:MAG: transcription-repair coupling factor [Clostridiales bacterium]|nr:transcription-repair coupling factor [Clostridiales bacterium]